ncbi:sulfatase family protein [Lusitaniella coriacea]|uniref:sulfatase family protein n=1 Tax=Lusitaniella coriacea TaxID=1983105 RepID=UPI003CE86C4E
MGQINQWGRRSFIQTCIAAGTTVLASKVFAQTPPNRQRNVLLIVADDQGRDQLGCYGNRRIETPHLDRLAAEGVKFSNAFAAVSSCSASRGTILTGLYPHQNGQYGHEHSYHNFRLQDWVQPLPALFAANQYRTGLIGKLHVGGTPQQFPFDFVVPPETVMGSRDGKTIAEQAGVFFNEARDRAFFLLVGYSDPHRWGQFGNLQSYPGVTPKVYQEGEVIVPPFLPDLPEVRRDLAQMYQAVSRLDASVGLLLAQLKASGRDRETLIIYLSDNGIPFPGGKTNLYEPGVRLPLILSNPEIARSGKTQNAMVSFIDLVPTLLDWTGIVPPDYPLPGRSLLNQDSPTEWDRVHFSHTFHGIHLYYPMRGARSRQFKYIHNLFPELQYPLSDDITASPTWQTIVAKNLERLGKRPLSTYLNRPPEELYDLEDDPDETKNLAKDPRFASILNTLRGNVRQMQETTKDPWLRYS